jgi:hypothetical protein
MVRSVLFSVGLSLLLIYGVLRLQAMYQETLSPGVMRVDIYADRITYRTNRYPNASLFGIGLKAAKVAPDIVVLHDCQRMDDFEEVIDELRSQGYSGFELDIPNDC